MGKTAPLQREKGVVQLQIPVDRGSPEIFGNRGAVSMTVGVVHDVSNRSLEFAAKSGALKINSLEVRELKPIWSVT